MVGIEHLALSKRLPPVSVYYAASSSADRPSAERPKESLDDEIEQLSAKLERAKPLKAATAAPQQQATPSRRFVEPQNQLRLALR